MSIVAYKSESNEVKKRLKGLGVEVKNNEDIKEWQKKICES